MAGLLSGITDAIGLTDSGATEAAYDKAAGYTKEQLSRLDKVDLPDVEKMKLLLENPELVGLLEAEELGETALEDISTDPALKSKQLEALASLQQQADEGLTQTDKYAMEQLLGDVADQEQAQQAQIESEMQQRGMDSSGAALMAKMQNQQSSANQARDKAMQMAAQGQQNRMAALSQLGSQAGQMQAQDYGQQANVASARDAISQYNAQARQGTSAANLQARQNIENQKANLANQQQMYNKGLEQQQFQNRMQKAGAQNVASGNLANMYTQQAGSQAAADSSVMGTLGSLGAAAITSDVRAKVNIEDGSPEIENMLDKLQPYSYDYKDEIIEDPSMEGEQLGVMAQDLEQSPLGDEFVQEDETGLKRVDYGKMGSTQMAAISNLHDRLRQLEALLGRKK